MAIPESQLDTWSHQGSVTQSSDTYATVKNALLDSKAGYANKSFEVFLQGSYGNDTNIYSESDVDVVIRLDSIYQGNVSALPPEQQAAYHQNFQAATYTFDEFKKGVLLRLKTAFGEADVQPGNKAIKIKANGSRRNADVVVCYQYRRYTRYVSASDNEYVPGIIFPTASGEIINYPKKHSSNLTSQHQASKAMLKPMVRILKNMRSRMVENGALKNGVAPSYYVEGLFYNVPSDKYVSTSYRDTFCNGINWLLKTDKSKLVCANWQYYLLGNSNVQWNEADYNTFLAALSKLWNEWQ
jgi:hypothetical protein